MQWKCELRTVFLKIYNSNKTQSFDKQIMKTTNAIGTTDLKS